MYIDYVFAIKIDWRAILAVKIRYTGTIRGYPYPSGMDEAFLYGKNLVVGQSFSLADTRYARLRYFVHICHRLVVRNNEKPVTLGSDPQIVIYIRIESSDRFRQSADSRRAYCGYA